MTTSIGHRWKGSNVRSRVVLIARWLAQTPPRGKPRGATNLFFDYWRYVYFDLIVVRPQRPPCPIIMSTILRLCRSPQQAVAVSSEDWLPDTEDWRLNFLGGPPCKSSSGRPWPKGYGKTLTVLGGHGDGAHPLPFRTGKLSPSAPMVLLHQVGE